jgi:hypothetical protein
VGVDAAVGKSWMPPCCWPWGGRLARQTLEGAQGECGEVKVTALTLAHTQPWPEHWLLCESPEEQYVSDSERIEV